MPDDVSAWSLTTHTDDNDTHTDVILASGAAVSAMVEHLSRLSPAWRFETPAESMPSTPAEWVTKLDGVQRLDPDELG